MEKKIYDNENGLYYTLHGDYYLPDLEINECEPTYGKYGMLRKEFLKESRSAYYQVMLMKGTLVEHLNQIDREAKERESVIVEQMIQERNVTEKLKQENQMKWVQEMNAIYKTAEEIVLCELVYTKH
jgi:hypothetical protein